MAHPSQPKLPTGTLTFLFSDIEGSTRLAQAIGTTRYREVLERHQALMRSAIVAHGGVERGTEGDSFFVVFAAAGDAVAAAVAAQRELAAEAWPSDAVVRVRMGLHAGVGESGGDDYVGLDVNRAARVAAVAHGGQIVLSDTARALAEAELEDGISVRDLGPHHLKDLDRPERLFQLVVPGLRSEFPPLRTPNRRAGNLPQRLTSFIGRDEERARVAKLLESSRLVTITGAGGTGKTSLAVAVATDVTERFADGSWFIALDAVADPELVPAAIARAFRLELEDRRSPFDRVVDFLREREAVLVLDNFEHLLVAAPRVRALLESAPRVRVLVASQAPLHLAGEQEFPLEPLPPPAAATSPVDDLAANPAVRLFVERARAVRPAFALDEATAPAVAAICARLDGLPLAIELAAAQVRLLSPAAILERVSGRISSVSDRRSDLPARQQTLDALVGWSYELLPDDQRALLRRLAVFAGGAALPEIERIVLGDPAVPDAFDALAGLVDRSLVRVDPAGRDRYALLETIRAFASARAEEAGEARQIERRHAEAFADLAEKTEPNLYRANRRAWLDRLAAEHDNLRIALDRMETAGEIGLALRIAAAAWRFWQQAGHLIEAIPRVERLLAKAVDSPVSLDPVLMSRVEEAAGGMAYWQRMRDVTDIEAHYQRSLEYARRGGDAVREAWATYNLSFAYDYVPSSSNTYEPDRERAEALRADALDRFRALGDDRGVAYTLWSMGGSPIAVAKGVDELRAYLAEALRRFREIDEAFGETWALLSTAMVEAEIGNIEVARTAILDAAALFIRDGDLSGQLVIIDSLAALAARTGDARLAVRIDAAGQEARRTTGTLTPPIAPFRDPIAAARAALGSEDASAEDEYGRTLSVLTLLDAALEGRQGTIRGALAAAPPFRRDDPPPA
ncbi:MAG TPA: adenylate/guanylate cyclase domain-containing protein [Candidatus Limnocylindrales bacterium]